MSDEKSGFEVDSGKAANSRGLSPAAVVEKWRIVVALLAVVMSFLLLALAAFIGTSWIGFKLFFVERPENDFFDVLVSILFYGLFGLVVFIYPIFVGLRLVFKKIIGSGVKNV